MINRLQSLKDEQLEFYFAIFQNLREITLQQVNDFHGYITVQISIWV